jgi:ABC-type polar amino acid transport system ATPase subunit
LSLKVKDLWRTHPGAKAPTLRGLSFELEQGTLAAVLGASGAGKSTLLRCVVGLETFEKGTIDVEGSVVKGTSECTAAERVRMLAEARLKLGLVFQSFELFPHLTALENCTLAPVRVRGVSETAAAEKARALLDQLGLAEHATRFPEQLSGGQRQRVAIARALAMEPRVLLYDEPTSALDPSMKGEVLSALKRVDATGVTQVVVTHDVQLARAMEQVCVLDAGVVVEAGAPEQVLGSPAHESTRKLLGAWDATH